MTSVEEALCRLAIKEPLHGFTCSKTQTEVSWDVWSFCMVVSASYCVIMWCWSCDPFIWFSDHVIPSFYHTVLPCDLAFCMCPIMWSLMMIMWFMQLLLQVVFYTKDMDKWKCVNVSVPAGIRNCCIGLTLTCLCNVALHACWLQ